MYLLYRIKLSFLIIVISSFSIIAQAEKDTAAPLTIDGAINKSKQVIKDFMMENKVPGMSAAASINGRLIFSEGFGYADLENGVSATKHTKFRIASISKPITASGLALLYEKGIIDLDEPIQKYLPAFPEKRWKVTLRNLASHQAGIRGYLGKEFLSNQHFDTVSEGVDIFRNDTLVFKPGTKYGYSTYGYNLISEVIEGASGKDFLTFVQKNIFDPLNMNSIIADHSDSLIAHRSSFYSYSDSGEIVNSKFVDISNKWAGGGFISNAEDLVKFGNANIFNGFLEEATRNLFFSEVLTASGEKTKYGLGWVSDVDQFGFNWVGHSGGAVGGRSMLILYPEDKIVVALLTNLGPAKAPVAEAQEIANFLRQTFNNKVSEVK
ncbi:MAG: beta-lactamase family protein [Ignavibacteriae bacterium]|nr:class A beta-lactamase-related serine hydrolase [Ignavibacteriota bacterium]NOG99184.1 beta-lactamase family protein [Ignavibacteriota bacterium]